MATKPELHIAIAYGKNKASLYNDNFGILLDYIEEVSEELNLKVNTINSQLSSSVLSNLQSVYPIGSLYIGINDTCPIANLFGTWEKVAEGLCLQGAKANQIPGTAVEAGLPDIQSTFQADINSANGAIKLGSTVISELSDYHDGGGVGHLYNATFRASYSNSIYGKSNTVQPPTYLVNVWKRTA